MTTRQDLISYAEDNFRCVDGPSRAFFEIPQVHGDSIRAVYVSYVGKTSTDHDGLRDWMLDIFVKLKEAGGVWWWWRMEEFIQEGVKNGLMTIRTRIAVLDKDLNSVVLEDAKPEGGPVIYV